MAPLAAQEQVALTAAAVVVVVVVRIYSLAVLVEQVDSLAAVAEEEVRQGALSLALVVLGALVV